MIYFVPEADQQYTELGLEPGMMGYFASRAAAMGAVPAEVVVATFFNFEPQRIRSLVPEAWRRVSAADLWDARLRAVDSALHRLLGERLQRSDIAEAAAVLRRASAECRPEGRALYAGHAAQAWDAQPHLALWQAVTLLREYRGDGHIAALTAADVTGCEALVLHAATGLVPARVLQSTRGWSNDEWSAATDRLRARGWIDTHGALTSAGSQHRADVAALTDVETDFVAALGRELSSAIVAAGTFGR